MLIVFGSVNADLVFRVPALPRPGETVLCPGYEIAAGGKGANQAAAAAKAGADVRMVGCIGDDGHGAFMTKVLTGAGVDCGGLKTTGNPTGIALIGVDPAGENAIIVASGANLDAAAEQIADADLGPGTTLLCQNEVPPVATFAAIGRARARGARTVLNLAPAGAVPPSALEALDVLVVNEHEAATAAGEEGGRPEDLADRLAEAHGLTCVVTLGKEGAYAAGPDGRLRVGVLPIEPVDTTGAGDAFAGVLAAGLDAGLALAPALHRASVAAALACTRIGAQTSQPTAAEIDARLAELTPPLS